MFIRRPAHTGIVGASGIDMRWTPSFVALWIGVTALYVAAAKAGLAHAVVGNTVTLAWAPSGIALAALLVYGCRLAFGVALGAFLANAGTGIPLRRRSIAMGNTLEALVGASFLRFPGFRCRWDRRGCIRIDCLAAFFSTMLSASVGVATLGGRHRALRRLRHGVGEMVVWGHDGRAGGSPATVVVDDGRSAALRPGKSWRLCAWSCLVLVSQKIFGSPELRGPVLSGPTGCVPFRHLGGAALLTEGAPAWSRWLSPAGHLGCTTKNWAIRGRSPTWCAGARSRLSWR